MDELFTKITIKCILKINSSFLKHYCKKAGGGANKIKTFKSVKSKQLRQ